MPAGPPPRFRPEPPPRPRGAVALTPTSDKEVISAFSKADCPRPHMTKPLLALPANRRGQQGLAWINGSERLAARTPARRLRVAPRRGGGDADMPSQHRMARIRHPADQQQDRRDAGCG